MCQFISSTLKVGKKVFTLRLLPINGERFSDRFTHQYKIFSDVRNVVSTGSNEWFEFLFVPGSMFCCSANVQLQQNYFGNVSFTSQRLECRHTAHRGELEYFLTIVWVLEFVPSANIPAGRIPSRHGTNLLSTTKSNLETYQNCRNYKITTHNALAFSLSSSHHHSSIRLLFSFCFID